MRPPLTPPLLALALLALVALGAYLGRDGLRPEGDGVGDGLPCPGLAPEECPTPGPGEEAAPTPEYRPAVLPAGEVCPETGYLCAEVERAGTLRILRWPDSTAHLRVWVPEAEHLAPDLARELQRAAVRGILAWDGHPFPLSVRTRTTGEEPDIAVRWVESLGEGRIGRARVEWARQGEAIQLTVLGLDLATQTPADPLRPLSPREIQLVAAHEMGHALGLPHSDDARDVMFPTNTALGLSVRDYRTMEALYALPNGAEIRK